MHPRLFAYVYKPLGSTGPQTFIDLSSKLEDVTMGVQQDGGLRNLEAAVAIRPERTYGFLQNYLGKRLVILDQRLDVVAEGTIMVLYATERGMRLSCLGPYWDACFRQVYNDAASWVDPCTTSEVIKDILTTECPAVSADQSGIDETNTDPSPWQTAENAYPGGLIPRLAAMSDDQHREWYFWLKSAPLLFCEPQPPIPFFKPQLVELIDFWVDRVQCPEGGLELSPSIMEFANDVRVMYRDAAGAQQQTGSAVDAESKSRFWNQEVWDVTIATVPQTVAEQYRDLYLARYKDPQQSSSFRVTGWIRDSGDKRFPLWELIKKFPCTVGIRDLDATLLKFGSIDHKTTFAVAAARYNYARNELAITPDLEEKTLENLLALWMGAG